MRFSNAPRYCCRRYVLARHMWQVLCCRCLSQLEYVSPAVCLPGGKAARLQDLSVPSPTPVPQSSVGPLFYAMAWSVSVPSCSDASLHCQRRGHPLRFDLDRVRATDRVCVLVKPEHRGDHRHGEDNTPHNKERVDTI